MLYIGLANFQFLMSYLLAGHYAMRNRAYYVLLFALFLFSAFRYQVGCDWSGYYFQYVAADYVAEKLIRALNEPIWWWIIQLVKEWEFAYPVLNVISSAIFFIGVHVLARRQPDPFAFLVLLFPILIINMPMSGIRQGAAIGLICIAFAAFIDRRPARFVLWVLIAGGFHASALVFLLLVPLVTGRFSKTRLLIAAAFAVPGIFFLASGDSAGIAVTRYISRSIDAFGAIFRVGAIFLSAIYFFYFVRKKWAVAFPRDYSLVSIGAIGMALAMLLLPVSSVIADRFAYYLIPIQAMIFARLPYLQFNSSRRIHAMLPYVGLLVMFVVWTQTSSLFNGCYLPYQSWIFGMPRGFILKEGPF